MKTIKTLVLALVVLISGSVFAGQSGDFTYTDNGTYITITGYTGAGGAVTIPDSIIGKPVTSIADTAFYSCHSLTSVTIGSSVTSIGNEVFLLCTGLTIISVSPSNLNYSSDGGVLFNKGKTVLLQCPEGKGGTYNIPNTVTSIGEDAFLYCSSLTSMIIPNSVISIGYEAFKLCNGLTSVTIPNSVTSIGMGAFENCKRLTSVTVGSGVTSIGEGVFSFCPLLTSVSIPNSVTSIGDYAFSDCTGLSSVTIPNSVTSIGKSVFGACTGLARAYFLGDAPIMGTYVFDNVSSGFTVYFIEGAKGFTLPTWEGYPSAIFISIRGTVSGDIQQGVTLILSGTASSTTTSGGDGTFTFAVSDGSYIVTPNLSGYTFAPMSKIITVSGNNVTGCDFVATKNPGTYSISGTVSGAIQEGISITLSGALSSTTPSSADGTYSFTGLADGIYTVTPELSGYVFAPFSQDVTIAGANKPDINYTATAISIFGTISKPSFNASYKDSVKKIVGIYSQYSTDKFTIQATIQFPETFVLTNIGVETGLTFDFGLYSFSGKLGNGKSKFNGEKGGSASFKITENDEIKGKMVTIEKVDLRWDKNRKLTVKITGTPASNSSSNVVDLSGKANGPVTGNIDTFVLTFNNAGANFAEGESLAYTGKKNSKTVIKDKGKASEKTFTLVDWSAKGKK